ncbi:MAG TPA: DUF4411 family protein [Spirochaetota bacterium]|nr:DUF4411 family protein [Spirochaetota bacterium]HNT12737.1 DUF4411 family protein [Spirochaetota bacterium]
MTTPSLFLLDSDVFITAKNTYYAFDICPGFWNGILLGHRLGRVFSIDRVHGELLTGTKTEDLVQWVKNQVPIEFFLNVDEGEVPAVYTEIMMWSQRNPQYFDYAKAKFATGADGWLVAYAKVHNGVVITNEQPAPNSKKGVQLPDVCTKFDVPYKNTYAMLRELAIKLELAAER